MLHLLRRVFLARCLILLMLVAVVPLPLRADPQTGQISGTVRSSDGKPLANVSVEARSGSGTYHAVTNAKGFYAILNVAPDTYTVNFSAKGFTAASVPGVTAFAAETQTVNQILGTQLKTIASTRARSSTGAYQPTQTYDSYVFGQNQILAIQGKEFNADEKSLLENLPSITVDRSGTIEIRGGAAFQTGYEYEGIDYTTPNRNIQNPFSNVGNFNFLNGVGSVQIIPGGGDASHGNTGTGLVLFRAKRGTYPGFLNLDIEHYGGSGVHKQYAAEWGVANKDNSLSNYASLISARDDFAYGPKDALPAQLGRLDVPPNYNSSTFDMGQAYYAPARQGTYDFVDNMFFRFGRNKTQQLQFFMQSQLVNQALDYGIPQGTAHQPYGYDPTCDPTSLCAIQPLYPGGSLTHLTTMPDTINSRFTAYKFEYSRPLGANASLAARVYRTFASEDEQLPGYGEFTSSQGGSREGLAIESAIQAGENHLIQVGMKYEFATPYGDVQRFDQFQGFTGVVSPTIAFAQNSGAYGTQYLPTITNDFAPKWCGCKGSLVTPATGYLAQFFPNGVPRVPMEEDQPDTNQQTYALFVQDNMNIGQRMKVNVGLRYNGYNFLIPDDPNNPPSIVGLAHQRQLDPHIGVSYQLTRRDAFRANFGHSLAVPLPSFLGQQVLRSTYNAFNSIPSFNNTTGGPAIVCGIHYDQPCKNYADELYWLQRNYTYPEQALGDALRGATFTNYDFSYAHDFGDGLSLKLTPFYRRGYNVVQESENLINYDEFTGLPIYSQPIYSNLGMQRTTGVEFLLTKEAPFGLSGQFGATYVNQIGNDPPGYVLQSADLIAGQLYHSPELSPLQASLALTYKTRNGWRINPTLTYWSGYPYGVGNSMIMMIGGYPYLVPNTDVTGGGQANSGQAVDPQNPGTLFNPNIAATRGWAESSSAGGLYSPAMIMSNLTIEYTPPDHNGGKGDTTFGVAFHNLGNQLFGIPQLNTRYGNLISTGTTAPGGGAPAVAHGGFCLDPSTCQPYLANAYPLSPYLIFPNHQPFNFILYMQVHLK